MYFTITLSCVKKLLEEVIVVVLNVDGGNGLKILNEKDVIVKMIKATIANNETIIFLSLKLMDIFLVEKKNTSINTIANGIV